MADRYTYGFRSTRNQRSRPPSRARYSMGFWAKRATIRYAAVGVLAIIFVFFLVSRHTSREPSPLDVDMKRSVESEREQNALKIALSRNQDIETVPDDDLNGGDGEHLNTQDKEDKTPPGESHSDKKTPSPEVVPDDDLNGGDGEHLSTQDKEDKSPPGESHFDKKTPSPEVVPDDDLNGGDGEHLSTQDEEDKTLPGVSHSDKKTPSPEVVPDDDLNGGAGEHLSTQDEDKSPPGESHSDKKTPSPEVVPDDDLNGGDGEHLSTQDEEDKTLPGESHSDKKTPSPEVVPDDDLNGGAGEHLSTQDEDKSPPGESHSDKKTPSPEVVPDDDLNGGAGEHLSTQDEDKSPPGESHSDKKTPSPETVPDDDLNGGDNEHVNTQDKEDKTLPGVSHSDKKTPSPETVPDDDLNGSDGEHLSTQDKDDKTPPGESHSDKKTPSPEVVPDDDLNGGDGEHLNTQDEEDETLPGESHSDKKTSSPEVVPDDDLNEGDGEHLSTQDEDAKTPPGESHSDKKPLSKGVPVTHLTTSQKANATGVTDKLKTAHEQQEERRVKQGLSTGADVQKRDTVKKMMVHAWSNYVKYAWGSDELDPQSKRGSTSQIFGNANIGATIVDSLDTLYVMGLMEEFDTAKEWVAHNLTFDKPTSVSVFEFNIRFLGGLLSAFALTGDEVFKEKAVVLAERLLPAFNTKTGLPCNQVNLNRQGSQSVCTGATSLARLGTFSLEWMYLTNITGNMQYYDKVKTISSHMQSLQPPHGIPPDRLSVDTGEFVSDHVTMGAPGDSYFEYLIKSWLMSGKNDTESAAMYFKAIDGFETRLLKTTSDGLKYFAQQSGDKEPVLKMDHLACFSAGMFALTALNVEKEEILKRDHFLRLAREIATTCHESYNRTATHIGPEVLVFSLNGTLIKSDNPSYLLRPETVESYFYLWRATHNPQYRQWGWDVVQAIEKHCRLESGYIGLHSVYEVPAPKESVQQSYFMAETLKYLYLLFSDDTVLSLNKWVFNTEGHPLPLLYTSH